MTSQPIQPANDFVAFNRELIPTNAARVLATDPGTRFGIGCFETMRLYLGSIQFLEDHLARMQRACTDLSFPPAPDPDSVRDLVQQLSIANRIEDGVVRLSFHLREDGSVDEVLTTARLRPIFDKWAIQLTTARYPHPGPSPVSVHKHNNYALQWIALREAQASGADDAVFLNSNRAAVETAISNLFIRIGDTIHAPGPAHGALPGVIRQQVLRVAADCGIRIETEPPSPDAIRQADACWVSNALIGLRPVTRWEDQTWPHANHDPYLQEIRTRAGLSRAYTPPTPESRKQI